MRSNNKSSVKIVSLDDSREIKTIPKLHSRPIHYMKLINND